MDVMIHTLAKKELLGTPFKVETENELELELTAIEEMVVDEQGQIHGGFTLGSCV